MSRSRILAVAIIVILGVVGLIASDVLHGSTKAVPSVTATSTATHLDKLPVSMASIDSAKGIYYLGVGSGVLTSWGEGAKSVAKDGSISQQFIVYLTPRQAQEFKAMGGSLGPITADQAEMLSYDVVIYSQRLTISELKAGHPEPHITFAAVLR